MDLSWTDYPSVRHLLLLLSVACLLPFQRVSAQDEPLVKYEGSSTIGRFIEDAADVYGKATFQIITETESAGGEHAIIDGTADLGGVARTPSPQALGKGVVSTLIGWDAIAVIVNVANPVDDLSKEQLSGIFSGRIRNWNEVGGPDQPISPYIVNSESATHNVFRSAILGVRNYADCQTVSPDEQVITEVADDPWSIGQISFSFLPDAVGPFKTISVSGGEASVTNQTYPITRPLYLLWWPGRTEVADFIDWCRTPEAQSLILQRFIAKSQETSEEKGKLIVYSATNAVEEGGAYYYSHEPYEIYSSDNRLLHRIENRLEPTDENPTTVTLAAGNYLIWTETAKSLGGDKLLVTIEAGAISRVNLESEGRVEKEAESESALSLYGDFRFRAEQDWDSQRSNGSFRDDRGRLRYRLRFGFNYKRNEHVTFGGRLRSGHVDDRQSPHGTLGQSEGHSISIDRAYFKGSKGRSWFWAGKNSFPFWKQNELWWDDDLTPEGIALGSSLLLSDRLSLKPVAAYFVMGPFGGELVDAPSMIGGQLVVQADMNKATLTFGSGYYAFSDLLDRNDVSNTHFLDYSLVNTSLKVNFRTRTPLTIGLDHLANLESYGGDSLIQVNDLMDERIGYVSSIQVGSLAEKGDVLFAYYYSFIPKYAVIDHLAQDDYVRWDLGNDIGTRSSNFKGHEFRLSYSFGGGFNVVARTYFVEAVKKERRESVALETGNRFRLDLNLKF